MKRFSQYVQKYLAALRTLLSKPGNRNLREKKNLTNLTASPSKTIQLTLRPALKPPYDFPLQCPPIHIGSRA